MFALLVILLEGIVETRDFIAVVDGFVGLPESHNINVLQSMFSANYGMKRRNNKLRRQECFEN